MEPRGKHRRNLDQDENGGILLVGVFMCCLLTSLIWYLVGIGDAIIWRDRGQEVADTVALTSASCHARGMNIIAFLNLLMMATTALFLVIKLLDWGLMAASLICMGIPFAQAASAPLWQAHNGVSKFEDGFQKVIENVFPWIGGVQLGVAVAAPWWGYLSSEAVGEKYLDCGKHRETFSISLSMVPLDWLSRMQTARTYQNKPFSPIYPKPEPPDPQNPPTPKVYAPPGERRQFIMPQDLFGREGLPVSADKFNSLCTAVISVIPDFLYQFTKQKLPAINDILDAPGIKNVYTGWVRMQTYMLKEGGCPGPFWKSGQYTPADPKAYDDPNLRNTDPQCTPDMQRRRVHEMELAGRPPKPGPAPPDPGPEPDPNRNSYAHERWVIYHGPYEAWLKKKEAYDLFESKHQERVNTVKKECEKNGTQFTKDEFIAAQKKNRDLGPKFMVGYAVNGNDWMQVWGWAAGPPPGDSVSREMMKVVPRIFHQERDGQSKVEPASHIYYAQSEFYLDCHDRWFSACNNFNLATFKVSWRARLRRVKHPDIVSDIVTAAIGSFFASDWARDRFRQWFPDANNLAKKRANLLWNLGFAVVKSNILYETNLLAGHGEVYPDDLH